MTFEWPLSLLALLALPLAAIAYAAVERRRARFALRFTNVDVLLELMPTPPPARRRFAPAALFLLALALAVVALARPHVVRSEPRPQATVVLVIDTSGSMVAGDVQPTRLGAAQEAVRRFVRRLPRHFQVGIVAFSSGPRVLVPITDDHEVALHGLERLTAFGGTAIGDAIRRAVELLRPGSTDTRSSSSVDLTRQSFPPSAIVVLSDGSQNRGRLPALEGATLAKKRGIPVYTVALGTAGGTLRMSYAGTVERLPVPPDPGTLRQIAERTGGRFYAAGSSDRLNAVYERLATRLSVRRTQREATSAFLGASSVLLVAAGVLSALWLPRLP
ncbi:MAG: vWA domain-containing protein [Gaiellaceae bacterium]